METGAIQEMDENYDNDSSDIDEDELNHRIQKKSTDSPDQIDVLTRSRTEPTRYTTKNKSNKSNKSSKKKKSKHKSNNNKYKRDDDINDMDIQSVEDDNQMIINEDTITEDDVYIDISNKNNDNNNNNKQQKSKRSSTLDMVKNGIMSAKKRLLSPESGNNISNGNNNGANSEISDENESYITDQQHKKSQSKTKQNLSSIKAKLQNMKKSYSKNSSSKTISKPVSKTPTPQQMKSSSSSEIKYSKKKKGNNNNNANNNNSKDDKIRKRSSSQNKSKIKQQKQKQKQKQNVYKSHMKVNNNNNLLKRHSMQAPIRSRSKPQKQQSNNNNNNNNTLSKPMDRNKERGKSMETNESSNGHGNNEHKCMERMPRKSASHVDTMLKLNKKSSSIDYKKQKRERKKERENKEFEDSIEKQDKKCKFRIKNEIFELYEYYKPIRLIGSGAYAVVCEAIDERTKKRVAIKKNKHIFDDIRDARRILREIKLLLHFNKYHHPDLIEIYDSLPPIVSEIQTFEDVYIVMPLLESNLCKIITSKQKLSNLHYQYLTYQVLRGLSFIHESGVIHRDIKPENILLNGSDCDVKIIDFGLARGVLGGDGDEDNPENVKATEYVCTRWYRSPEVMCSGGRYDEKMDIWGVGCILAEMILRRPLFPGANYLDQLQQIFDIMGTPKYTKWILNDQARNWVQKLPKHNGKNIKKMIKHKFDENNCSEEDLNNCTDLIYKLLALNPADRISAKDSLSHPYFKDMHDQDEVLIGDKFDLSFEFEQSIKTKFGVRHMMYTELDKYHKKQWIKIKKKLKRKAQKEKNKKKDKKDKKDKHRKKHKHREKH